MATINASFNTASGGSIDKYKVTLYNSAGTSVLTTRVFTPSFPGTITASFSGLTSGVTYKVGLTSYIGTIYKDCPLQSIVALGGGSSDVFIFNYGATEADTTGAPLTEGEYVTSVHDAETGGNNMTDAAPLGGNVAVDDFANGVDEDDVPIDKVMYIGVPSTEAAFTKWSEVGNIYQQDQPIDQTFSGTNVWFRTVQGGTTYYITRSQTDFAGAIVLSR